MGCYQEQIASEDNSSPLLKGLNSADIKSLKMQSLSFAISEFEKSYDAKENIGSGIQYLGGSGKCMRVVDKTTGHELCAKFFRRYKKKMIWKEQRIKKEIEILKHLDHPNICKLHDYFFEANFIYLVMELLTGGDLLDDSFQHCEDRSEKKISIIMEQVLSAVHYIHTRQICHRDIKVENILYKNDTSNIIKLIDFGSATEFKEGIPLTENVGTAYYMAPEVILGNYNEKCDIWSCGVLLNILLSNLPPYTGNSEIEIMEKIKAGGYNINQNPLLEKLSNPGKDLLNKMLCPDPKERFSAWQCLNHEWFAKPKEEINLLKFDEATKEMLNYKPKELIETIATKYLISHIAVNQDLEEAQQLFEIIDVDKSTTITREELSFFLQRIYPNKISMNNEVEKIFNNFDLNGNNILEYSEFLSIYIKGKKVISEEMLKKAFQALDYNNSGKIGSKSLFRIFQNNTKLSEEICKSVIINIDKNSDESIDFEEFSNLMKKALNIDKM